MKPTWVYSLGRCRNEGKLHVVRTRHPDSPMPQLEVLHGPVPIGQFHSATNRRRERRTKPIDDIAAVIREAFPTSERARLRDLAAA